MEGPVDREECVYMAKLAEQAERYDEMARTPACLAPPAALQAAVGRAGRASSGDCVVAHWRRIALRWGAPPAGAAARGRVARRSCARRGARGLTRAARAGVRRFRR